MKEEDEDDAELVTPEPAGAYGRGESDGQIARRRKVALVKSVTFVCVGCKISKDVSVKDDSAVQVAPPAGWKAFEFRRQSAKTGAVQRVVIHACGFRCWREATKDDPDPFELWRVRQWNM